MKNAVLAAAAIVAVAVAAPSIARAELRLPKQRTHVPRAMKAQMEATAVAMNAALTIDSMLDKINGVYMRGLRRCYNKGLATDPLLKGKITLTFSIGSYGKVWGEANGISDTVDQCVADQVKRWNFGRPSDKREQNYRISLVLSQ
jgi:hypothetical protein